MIEEHAAMSMQPLSTKHENDLLLGAKTQGPGGYVQGLGRAYSSAISRNTGGREVGGVGGIRNEKVERMKIEGEGVVVSEDTK